MGSRGGGKRRGSTKTASVDDLGLSRLEDDETREWASALVPWVDPDVFEGGGLRPLRPRGPAPQTPVTLEVRGFEGRSPLESIRRSSSSRPCWTRSEGHECEVETWKGTEKQLRELERERPHLAHVVEKIMRYRRERVPPEWMMYRALDVELLS